MTSPKDVLSFWFGDREDPIEVNAEKSVLWWKKKPAVDDEIARTFGEAIERAAAGDLDSWKETANGRLALVILLDQFNRNIHRGKPESFASDSRARELAQEGIRSGHARELPPIRRYFLFMPLMHAEDREVQNACVRAFEELRDSVSAQHRSFFEEAVKYAVAHRDIVERFGRFPHRNAILGRESTPEEVEFLGKPGSSF